MFHFCSPFPSATRSSWLENPVLRPWFEGLARRYQLVVFDSRGNGLSQRDVTWSPEAFALDLEAVVDALSLTDVFVFAPIGYGHGAIRYARRASRSCGRAHPLGEFRERRNSAGTNTYRQPRRTELGVLSADDSFIAALARTKRGSCVRGYAQAKQHAAGLPVIHKSVPRIGYRVFAASRPDAYVGLTSQGT